MDIIKEIEAKLQKYPHVKFEKCPGFITIFPKTENGFDVSLRIDDCYEVDFAGWHEEFSDPQEAFECLAFGLSKECRLKVYSRGNRDHKWTLEYLNEGQWEVDSETGLFFYPFWKPLSERYLQNELID